MHAWQSRFLRYVAQTSPAPDGFEVSKAEGIFLYDQHGNQFIDCISGIAVSSLGHHHPVIGDAIRKQLDQYLHTTVYGEHVQQPQVELAELLASLLPKNLNTTYFVNSGAEAVEGALKLARKFTGRYNIVACRNAYHGSTLAADALRSDHDYTNAFKPLLSGVRHIDFNDADQLDRIDDRTAAIILETVQGEAGVIEPAPGYLKAVRHKCNESGALLILDEIQAGMGRTGSLWAFEQEGIEPDILLLAKAFGGGLPLGAFIADHTIMSSLSHDPILGHMTTFGGNPLCCAAGLAALRFIAENRLFENAQKHHHTLRDAMQNHPLVHQVRGRGLMMAIELKHPDALMSAIKACRENGLLIDWFLFNDRSLRLYPPLTITQDEIGLLIRKLTSAFNSLSS